MYRLILLVVAVHASCASTAMCSDYILRVDTIRHTDGPPPEREPRETTLRSIEVFARPHMPIHGRLSVGSETVSVAGTFCPADNGEFTVQLRYEHSVDAGLTVPGGDGTQEPIIGKSSFQTSITIPVGTRVDIGGLDKRTVDPGKPEHQDKIRHVVTLLKMPQPAPNDAER